MPDIMEDAFDQLTSRNGQSATEPDEWATELTLDARLESWLRHALARRSEPLPKAAADTAMVYQRLAVTLSASQRCPAVLVASCDDCFGAKAIAFDMASGMAAVTGERVWLVSDSPPDTAVRPGQRVHHDTLDREGAPPLITIPPAILLAPEGPNLLAQMKQWSGAVVVHGDPILVPGNGIPLAARCDCTVLVIDAGRTSRENTKRAIRHVRDAGGRVGGLILDQHRSHVPRWLQRWL